jgi:hypothetical protein
MLTASVAALDVAARHREEWLYDIYAMGRAAMTAGADETWLVPAGQWDPGAAAVMVEALRIGGVAVERAAAGFAIDGARYGAGTFVIRGAQPFRPYLVDLLGVQRYPELHGPAGAPMRPYDITGWTLPAQMGVRVDRVPRALAVPTVPVTIPVVPALDGEAPAVTSTTVALALDPRANAAHQLVSRVLHQGHAVARAAGPLSVGGVEWPPGTFLVSAFGQAAKAVSDAAGSLGVPVGVFDVVPPVPAWPLAAPRVGLYQAWGGNADEGWTRFVFDRMEVPVTTLHDADIRAGGLRARFDVIVLPDAGYDAMLHGLAPGSVPDAYAGGLTPRGVASLYEFTAAGGTLVAADSATELPVTTFGLRWTHLTRGLSPDAFSAPGTLVRLEVDPAAPLGFGMPSTAVAFVNQSAAFAPRPGEAAASGRIAARYADRDVLVSGWLRGETHLAGRAAVLDIPVGNGRTVLLGVRAQHRGQAHGTFKLLLNTLWLPATSRPPVPAPGLLPQGSGTGAVSPRRPAGDRPGAIGPRDASKRRR